MGAKNTRYAPETVAKEAPPTRQAMARALSASGALGGPPDETAAGLSKKNFRSSRPTAGLTAKRSFRSGEGCWFDVRSAAISLDDRFRFLYVCGLQRPFGRASRAVRITAEDTASRPSRIVDIHAVNKPKHEVCAHLREIAVLRELKHENLETHLDFLHNRASGVLYIITPLHEWTLEDVVLEFGGVGLASLRAERIFRQLLDGIQFMHNNHIFHRNLGPKGIFFDAVGGDRVIIADFALSWCWKEDDHDARKSSRGFKKKALQSRLARHERLPYMAPEVVRSWLTCVPASSSSEEGSFERVDLWSLGALLVFVHRGRPPFGTRRDTAPGKLIKRILKSPPDLVGLEQQPCAVLARGLLQKRPKSRISIEDAIMRLQLKEGSEEKKSNSITQYVAVEDTTPENEVAAVKPVEGPIVGALRAKQRFEASLHVGRVARGTVARMRIQKWRHQEGMVTQGETNAESVKDDDNLTGRNEELPLELAAPALDSIAQVTDKTTNAEVSGVAGSESATTTLGRTVSAPTIKLNRKKRPLLRLGTSDDDLVELIHGVQMVSPSKDELIQKVSNYLTVRVKLGNWELGRQTLKGSIDARVMIPELENTWGGEVGEEAMIAEFRGPLDQSHWLVRDHILVYYGARAGKTAKRHLILNELHEFKKIGITRFVILSPSGVSLPPRYSKASLTKVWRSQRRKKRSGSGDDSVSPVSGEANLQSSPRYFSPLSSPQALKRASSFGKQHVNLLSPEKSFTVPTLQQSGLNTDNDYRSVVDSVLESLILGDVILIMESGEAGLVATVSSMLLGRLYSFESNTSVEWVNRLRKTMEVEEGSAVIETMTAKADRARVDRILGSTSLDLL